MGFISYSIDYYCTELQKIESGDVTEGKVYRAKQLLKMLDDLADEGYMELNEILEESHQAISRLQKFLKDHHAEPFEVAHKIVKEADIIYESMDVELEKAIEHISEQAGKTNDICQDPFLTELIQFCEWVGYEEDTAYIFLLRDTLLPYIYYKSKEKSRVYPWLLGRKMVTMVTGRDGVDDEIRAAIIKALECNQCHDFEQFCDSVLPDIRETLKRYPQLESCLLDLLSNITQKRIIVVESGCSGTFPMLLMSLDSRVDIRMYTTYPYLLEAYGDKIYTPKYEENRLFETLYSQDLYFQFSDFKDGRFYVKKSLNKEVEKRALAEIRTIFE